MTAKEWRRYVKRHPEYVRSAGYLCAIVKVLGEDVEIETQNVDEAGRFDPAASSTFVDASAEPLAEFVSPTPRREPRNEFEQWVFDTYSHVFPMTLPKGLPPTQLEPIINVMEERKDEYPCKPQYKMTREHSDELKRQIEYYLNQGWIRPSSSPYGAPVLFIPKKNGKLRLCIDYRGINEITVKDKYPLPNAEQLFEQLQGAKYFSKIDAAQGYHQCKMHPSDIPKTAFRSNFGSFEWTVLSFGLSNAVPAFVRVMNTVLRPLLGVCCMCFIDDVLIFSKNLKDHYKHVKMVLDLLAKARIYANWEKCEFHTNETEYLGFIVGADGLRPVQSKVEAIRQWERPTTLYHVRSFLGAVGYYRRFIYNFAKKSLPLVQLTKMNENRPKKLAKNQTVAKWGRVVKTYSIADEWDDECEKSFNELKEAMMSAPVLRLPDNTRPYTVYCDASGSAIGGVLMQQDEDTGYLHPVAYFSKKLSPTQMKYPVHEQELLAIYECLSTWRHLLIGNHVSLYTDHKPLTHLKTQPMLSPRQIRWITFLADYDVEILAVEGSKNIIADALSRYAYDPADVTSKMERLRIKFLEDTTSHLGYMSNYYETTAFSHCSLATPLSLVHSIFTREDTANFSPGATAFSLHFDPEVERFQSYDFGEMGTISQNTVVREAMDDPGQPTEILVDMLKEVKASYSEDKLVKEINSDTFSGHGLCKTGDYVYFHDTSGRKRLYVPLGAQADVTNVATQTPLPGEEVRTRCTLREAIIRDIHSNGHFGMGKTAELVTRNYWWPGIVSDVRDYVRGCPECQQNKNLTHKMHGRIKPIKLPSRRWDNVSMDFITDLPKTKRGFNAILVVVDMFSKRAHFIPTTTTLKAKGCAELFVKEVYKHHGMPKKIVSDRDKLFTSNFWQTVFRSLGTQLAMTAAYNPQADGLTERTNRTLEEMLRSYSSNIKQTWDQYLAIAEFVYNDTVAKSTGFTPFELDCGQHPNNPHSLTVESAADAIAWNESTGDSAQEIAEITDEPRVPSMTPEDYGAIGKAYIQEWDDIVQMARANMQLAQDKMASYDKRTLVPFKVGDMVYIDTKFINTPNIKGKLTTRTTFDHRRVGPFKITRVIRDGRAYQVDLGKEQRYHNVFPISRLELVRESTKYKDAHVQPPPATIITGEGDEVFEVDSIVGERVRRGKLQYKVRFKGYQEKDDLFLDASELTHAKESIQDYLDSKESALTALLRGSYRKASDTIIYYCTSPVIHNEWYYPFKVDA